MLKFSSQKYKIIAVVMLVGAICVRDIYAQRALLNVMVEPTPTAVPDDEPTPTVNPDDEPTPTIDPDDEPTPTPVPDDEPTPTVDPDTGGSITGVVFYDKDGIPNIDLHPDTSAGDTPAGGAKVVISVVINGTRSWYHATADDNGEFTFSSLPWGTYLVAVNKHYLTFGTTPVTDPDGGNGYKADITLTPNNPQATANFSYKVYYEDLEMDVWDDKNGNGVYEPDLGESRLGYVDINIKHLDTDDDYYSFFNTEDDYPFDHRFLVTTYPYRDGIASVRVPVGRTFKVWVDEDTLPPFYAGNSTYDSDGTPNGEVIYVSGEEPKPSFGYQNSAIPSNNCPPNVSSQYEQTVQQPVSPPAITHAAKEVFYGDMNETNGTSLAYDEQSGVTHNINSNSLMIAERHYNEIEVYDGDHNFVKDISIDLTEEIEEIVWLGDGRYGLVDGATNLIHVVSITDQTTEVTENELLYTIDTCLPVDSGHINGVAIDIGSIGTNAEFFYVAWNGTDGPQLYEYRRMKDNDQDPTNNPIHRFGPLHLDNVLDDITGVYTPISSTDLYILSGESKQIIQLDSFYSGQVVGALSLPNFIYPEGLYFDLMMSKMYVVGKDRQLGVYTP